MTRTLLFFFSIVLTCTAGMAQVQSPSEFLPHELGAQFTPHHLLVDYVQHVAENSPKVQLTEYGRTNQGRPLLMAFISTEENLQNLEAIRQANLRRAGILEGTPDPKFDGIAIVWLSFGVHGNEAGGPESSMAVLHQLATRDDAADWLKNLIVIFDPSINPDGYSRYTHWYRNVAVKDMDPNPQAREHLEPWPGGRVNHYLFDLNRDWAWQTQIETRQRIARYNQWLPQIHVDFHEQGYNNPYYFAPAARPYHDYITEWQAEFQFEIGRNNAKYFNENGWLFFTREVFDLLYPSYGDTYPTFHGAIGMTYEQGGHSRAGRGITMENGDTLTLYDRIAHHTTTALSTVEVAARNAADLVANYTRFYRDSRENPPGEYRSFIIPATNPQQRIKALLQLLDRNGIRYGRAGRNARTEVFDYQTGETRTIQLQENDLVISAHQPLAVFTQVLLEPRTGVEDSLTYDITAWSLPYAYGLQAYASKTRLEPQDVYLSPIVELPSVNPRAYAFLLEWNALQDARFLATLLKHDIKVRYATEPFRVEGKDFDRGTLVITRADNRKLTADFDQTLLRLAGEHGDDLIHLIPVSTGFVENGRDFGSSSYRFIQKPRILVLSGESTSTNAFGQCWYFFEQDLDYPVTLIDADQLSRTDLDEYHLLIMPEGSYRLNDNLLEKLNGWISAGGRLIAYGRAVTSLADRQGFALTRYAEDETKRQAQKAAEAEALASRLDSYDGQDRRRISGSIPGAIFRLDMDPTHPLGFGLGEHYFSLKTSTLAYQHLKDAWNVGSLGEDLMVSGFAGKEARENQKNTVVLAVQDKGQGSVTYFIDNPLFRGFWENGKFLFSNAVFLVGQ